MGGPRLTPDQLAEAARVFGETNNVHEAARRIGVAYETLRDAFARERIARNRLLHAQACDRGLREGRKSLRGTVTLVDSLLAQPTADSPGMEPRDIAALLNAKTNAVATLDKVTARVDAQKLARLTREKTRAEIQLIRDKIDGKYVERVSHEGLSDDDIERRIAEKLRRPAGDDAGGAAGTVGAARGTGAAGEDP